jgi:hypothetical protein
MIDHFVLVWFTRFTAKGYRTAPPFSRGARPWNRMPMPLCRHLNEHPGKPETDRSQAPATAKICLRSNFYWPEAYRRGPVWSTFGQTCIGSNCTTGPKGTTIDMWGEQRPVCICGVGSLMAHSRDWGSQVRVPRHASRSEIQCTRILSGDQPSLRRVCEGRRDDGCVHYGRDAACPNANSPKRWVPSTTLSFRSSSTDEVVFHRTAIWFGLTPWGSSPVNLFWDSCPITTL